MTAGNKRSEFSYDGLSRRAKIVEKVNGSVTSSKSYVWCGGENCEERSGSSGDTVTKRYFPQGVQAGGTPYYYTRDHLGSIREALDQTGAVVTRYDYDAWGRQTKLSGSLDADFGYAGYWNHKPSGLNLTWYRAYDANLARWLSRDPIGEDDGPNLYAYVQNSPSNFTDPTGLKTYVCCRPLKVFFVGWFFKHCYILVVPDGGPPRNRDPQNPNDPVQTYGLHNKGGGYESPNDPTDTTKNPGKDCVEVPDWTPEKEGNLPNCSCPCRACGDKYKLLGPNSNTYVSDLLKCAGMTPPPVKRSPGYGK
ncbi:MAG: hypothetical protein K1Y36_28045 [Blastocatellia bacterium]|nr:hypothetical protein [Blastocatellia bacterium]